MAALGVPPGGGRNELDCRVRDELDDGGFLRRRLGAPRWKDDIGDGRTDFSACASRFRNHADLLVHLVLDVPPKDLLKDLSDSAKHAIQKNSFASTPWKESPVESHGFLRDPCDLRG